jgi:hypothetical protein
MRGLCRQAAAIFVSCRGPEGFMKKHFFLLACGLLTRPAAAEPLSWALSKTPSLEGFPAGVSPFFSTGARWESNVDLRGPSPGVDPRRDGAGFASAGMEAGAAGARSRARGSAFWEGSRFSRRKAYDARNGGVDGAVEWMPRPFWTAASGRFLDADDRLTTLAERVNRREWEGRAAAGLRGEGPSIEVRFEGLRRSYADDRFHSLGHRRALVSPALMWDGGGAVKGFVETAWGIHNARGRSPRDGSSFESRLGMIRFAPESGGEFRAAAGVLRRRFDQPGVPSFHGFTGEAGGVWRPGPRVSFRAEGVWEVEDSLAEPMAGYLRQKRGSLATGWSMGPKTSLSASFRAVWQHYAAATPGFSERRRDFLATSSLRVERVVSRGVTASLSWSHDRRGSNRTAEKYKAQTVSVSMEYRRRS